MWNDAQSKYLFAFEAAVIELVGLDGLKQFPTGLRDGLWCNAHMWHGMGLDAELAVVKFVVEVVAQYHPHLIADMGLARFLRHESS